MRYFIALFALLANALQAQITISKDYVRLVPPNAKNSAAFMRIHNGYNQDIKLINVRSSIAQKTEIHLTSTTHSSDHMGGFFEFFKGLFGNTNNHHNHTKMTMKRVDHVNIEANRHSDLKRGSYHVMLMGLKMALTKGQKIEMELFFDNGETITIAPKVEAQ